MTRDFFSQSQSEIMQNQSDCEITSDTKLKIAVYRKFFIKLRGGGGELNEFLAPESGRLVREMGT